jgi:hypothetical protein
MPDLFDDDLKGWAKRTRGNSGHEAVAGNVEGGH